MTMNENSAMRELHEIRVKLHEKYKNLPAEERIKIINDNASQMARKYNMRIGDSPNENKRT